MGVFKHLWLCCTHKRNQSFTNFMPLHNMLANIIVIESNILKVNESKQISTYICIYSSWEPVQAKDWSHITYQKYWKSKLQDDTFILSGIDLFCYDYRPMKDIMVRLLITHNIGQAIHCFNNITNKNNKSIICNPYNKYY